MIRALITNAGWLAIIQALNYVLPALTLPVVTRAFGPSIFGSLATITAFAAYVGLVASFGLKLSGPRLVVRLRKRPDELSDALSVVVGMQTSLGLIAAAVFMIVLFSVAGKADYRLVGAIILLQICFNSVTPDWAFLGLDRMQEFTIIQFVGRVLAASCIIAFIRAPADVLLYVTINGIAAVSIALASFAMLRRAGIHWRVPRLAAVRAMVRDTASLFLSTVSVNLYTTTSVIIVNFVLGPEAAGPFALADRLRAAVGNLTGPISSAIYPFVCRISVEPETDHEAWAKRVFFQGILVLSALLSLGLFIFAPKIIFLVGGATFADAVPILRILAVVPFLIAVSQIVAVQTMMPLGMDWHAARIYAATAVVGIAGMFVLTHLYGLRGSAFAEVATETIGTLAMIVVLHRKVNVLSLIRKMN